MAELIRVGKLRAWGISETTEDYLRRANAACPVTAVQNRYSMLAGEHEKLFPALEELNVAYVAFSPLGNGFLSSKYDANSTFETGLDYRSHMPQYTQKGLAAAQELMAYLGQQAKDKGATSGQFSLAWMFSNEKYVGEARMQKTFTVDFLTGRREKIWGNSTPTWSRMPMNQSLRGKRSSWCRK